MKLRPAAVVGWWQDIRPRAGELKGDVIAGLPGAISSVPDGMASSVLAGVGPSHGLYASFAGPIAGGLTSSTRLMVITTTSAAALAAGSTLAGVEASERSDAMLWLTLMAGALMVAAAIVNLSRYIRFVSYSVMLGFLTGVAVNMVLGQLSDLLGAPTDGGIAAQKAWYVLTHPSGIDAPTALAGAGALAILALLARTRLAVFSSLVALLVPTVALWLLGVDTLLVEDNGSLPHGIPLPGVPDPGAFSLSLVVGAASVAAIILVQGAGVAEAMPNPDGSRSSTRRDFTAQGVANVASGFFGGQVVGGSVGQSALNVTAGARSRWAAIVSGIWMLAILLLFAGLVGQVAMTTLAAVLVYAGWGTIRPREIWSVARAGAIPAIALIATFVAVLVLPVAEAVGVGVVASLLMQLNQEALDLRLVALEIDRQDRLVEKPLPTELQPFDVVVIDVYGSLFFAGTRTLQRRLPQPSPASRAAGPRPDGRGPVVVLRLRGRTTLGATFIKVVGDYAHQLGAVGGELYLSGVDHKLVRRWDEDGLTEQLGNVRVFEAVPIFGESTRAAVELGRSHRVAMADGPAVSPGS